VSPTADTVDEIVDLVDADDRVIGTVRKIETDSDPSLIHREVAVLVHRDGELLWQLRSARKTVMALTWDIACAGHVTAGEEPLAAAHRELREELGFDLELAVLERRLVRAPNETYFAYVFAGAAPAGLEPVLDADEVEAIEWCDAQAYQRWVAEGRRLSPLGRALADAFWELG
jgi:isopentenyldiphosphate isomerase